MKNEKWKMKNNNWWMKGTCGRPSSWCGCCRWIKRQRCGLTAGNRIRIYWNNRSTWRWRAGCTAPHWDCTELQQHKQQQHQLVSICRERHRRCHFLINPSQIPVKSQYKFYFILKDPEKSPIHPEGSRNSEKSHEPSKIPVELSRKWLKMV